MNFVALRYTTATFVTAFSNLAPVLTFLLAAVTRSEKLNLRTGTGRAKLAGTLVSLAGAMVLTFYKGVPLTNTHLHHSASPAAPSSSPLSAAESSRRWTLGTVAILGNCVCLACWYLLHGRLAKKYPYVYSCNAFMSTFSFLQVAAIGLCAKRNLAAWLITSKFQILTVLYAVRNSINHQKFPDFLNLALFLVCERSLMTSLTNSGDCGVRRVLRAADLVH
jgi:drug/metabolite transporter (DMT)-like permease